MSTFDRGDEVTHRKLTCEHGEWRDISGISATLKRVWCRECEEMVECEFRNHA